MKNRKWKRMSAAAIIATMTVTGGAYAWADEFKSVSVNDATASEEVTAPVTGTVEEVVTPVVDTIEAAEDNLYEETAESKEELLAVYQERIAKLNELIAMIDDEEINALLANAVERFEAKIEELEAEDDTTVEEPTEGDDDTEVEEPTEEEPTEEVVEEDDATEEVVEEDTTEADELAKKKEQLAFKIAIMTKVYDQVGSDQARAAIQKNMDKFQAQLDALNEEAPVEEAPVEEAPVVEEPVVEEPVVEEPTEETPTEEVVEEETTPVVAPVAKKAEKEAEKAAKKAEKEAEKAAKKAEQQAKVAEKKAAAAAKKVEAQAKAVEKKAAAAVKKVEAQAKKEEKGNKGKGNE